MYFLTSTWWVSRLCPWGHSATVQFSLKVNLALGPTATGHSTIPARMLHTIVTLSTGWANCARVVILALSGISSFTVHVCSRSCTDTAGSAFPEVSGSLSNVEHHWVPDGNQMPILGSKGCPTAEQQQDQMPSLCWCRLRLQAFGAMCHPSSCSSSAPAPSQVTRTRCRCPIVNLHTELHQHKLCSSNPVKLLVKGSRV